MERTVRTGGDKQMNPEMEVTDVQLVNQWQETREALEGMGKALHAIEVELRWRMVDRGATEIAHPRFMVKLRLGAPHYDPAKLLPLLEMDGVTVEALGKAYRSARSETRMIPAKWDGHGLAELKKLGGRVAELIEAATFRGDPTLEIKER